MFWELDPVAREVAEEAGDVGLEKEAWVSATLLEWGSCGKIALRRLGAGRLRPLRPAGLRAAQRGVPDLAGVRGRGAADDRRVVPEFTGGGLGRMLLQAAAKDLTRRGVRAIEAFGSLVPPVEPDDARTAASSPACVVPADFLLAVGFKTVRPHHRYPAAAPRAEERAVLARGRRGRARAAAGLDEPGAGVPAGLRRQRQRVSGAGDRSPGMRRMPVSASSSGGR